MITNLIPLLAREMQFGYEKHGRFHDANHQESVLRGEYYEWWDTIREHRENEPAAHYELLQVAAVALRFILERGDIAGIAAVQEKRHGGTA